MGINRLSQGPSHYSGNLVSPESWGGGGCGLLQGSQGPRPLRTWHFSASAERSSPRDSHPSAASSSPTCHDGPLQRTHSETAGLSKGEETQSCRRMEEMRLGARGEKGAPTALIQTSLQPQGLSLGPVNSLILQESPDTYKGSFKGLSLQIN